MVTIFRSLFSGPIVTGGGVCTLATEDPVDANQAQNYSDSIRGFWTDMLPILDEDVTITMDVTASRFAASDGSLQQVFNISPGNSQTGTANGKSAPRATQALIRWGTEDIVANRVVRGRTYVPGLTATEITDAGGLSTAAQTFIATAANDLLNELGGVLSIWHRPVNGAGGSSHLVTEASVWSEFAVLRSRRD